MTSRCILGVDPGLSGAIAFYFTDAPARTITLDMPVADGNVSGALIAAEINKYAPAIALIELVGAMPGQGVSSMFNFGKAFGQAIGAVSALNIPIQFVTPTKWKKHYGLSSDKEQCRAKAIALFPACAPQFARKKDHGRAEAALIARYGAETLFPASWAA